ncbi:MAG: NnrU family protein [Cyclobacteriaceae bacterium]
MTKFILLFLCWVLYFFLHSWLASTSAKHFAKTSFKFSDRSYRIFYVTLSSVGLILLLVFNSNIPAVLFFSNEGWLRYLSLVLTAFGVIIIKVSFREYDFEAFMGVKNPEGEAFSSNGILSKVRHPIYAGTILIVLGYFLFNPTMPTLVSMSCIFLYLPLGIYLEEQKLIKLYGEKYRKYKEEVPALFPTLF